VKVQKFHPKADVVVQNFQGALSPELQPPVPDAPPAAGFRVARPRRGDPAAPLIVFPSFRVPSVACRLFLRCHYRRCLALVTGYREPATAGWRMGLCQIRRIARNPIIPVS